VDGITHLLVGRLLAASMPASAPALGWVATLFAVLPDFDTVTWFVPATRKWLRHRGLTHTIPFGVAASLVAGAACALAGWASFPAAAGVALLAWTSHVALDVLNWGAPVLWPLRRAPVEWTVHGGFAWSAGLSASGVVLLSLVQWRAPALAGPLAAAFAAAFLAYLALRVALKLRVARRNPGARLVPTGNPFVWAIVAEPLQAPALPTS
jgi:membrane-bound metal-dependent hydrolase YbcI (DUF457 family)